MKLQYIAILAAFTVLVGCASQPATASVSVPEPTTSAEAVVSEVEENIEQSSTRLIKPNPAGKTLDKVNDLLTVDFSSNSVPIGDMMMITVKGAKGEVTATTTLGFTPKFFKQDSAQVAFLPVSYKTAPGSYELVIKANDETRRFAIKADDREFVVQHLTVDPTTTKETVGSQKANQEWNEKIEPLKPISDPKKYWDGAFLQPVTGRITTEYGSQRYTNGGSEPSRHGGIDIAAATGTTVAATGAGRVLFADFIQLTGNTVIIEHGYGLKSFYYHMNSLNVEAEEMVERGQKVGEVGTTGFSTGPHLHFAMAVNNVYTNPWTLFEKELV